MNILLAPPRRDLAAKYELEFEGMTVEPVSLEDLEAAREAMVATMVGDMPDAHRRFLLTFKRGDPDWDLLGLPHVADLPAVRYRQRKLSQLPAETRDTQIEALEHVLSGER